MKKLIPALLMLLLVVSPIARTALAQQLIDPTVAKVRDEIVSRFRDEKRNVTLRLRNGSELTGRITQAAENWFSLKEKGTGTQRDISYADVTKVKGRGLSKGAKFGILTGIITGAVIIGALISLKHFDPFKNGVLR